MVLSRNILEQRVPLAELSRRAQSPATCCIFVRVRILRSIFTFLITTLYSFSLSSTISRVLYQTVIFLDCTLPHSSSARLPGQNATNPEARRAAVSLPIRSCFGWSLHSLVCYQPSGGLLPRHSTITRRKAASCFFSIALVLESPPPDVIRHPAL